MSKSVEERLASLEKQETYTNATLDEVRTDVKEIKAGLNKQKGFIAGIMFIVVPLWSALVMFLKTFWDKVTG